MLYWATWREQDFQLVLELAYENAGSIPASTSGLTSEVWLYIVCQNSKTHKILLSFIPSTEPHFKMARILI